MHHTFYLVKGNSKIIRSPKGINHAIGGAYIIFLCILNLGYGHANNLTNLFKESGLEVGGWINGGATYNANNPSDGFNGTVTFADRANRFQLDQFFPSACGRSAFNDRDGWRVFPLYRILSATNNKGISYAGNIPFIGAPADYLRSNTRHELETRQKIED